MSNTIRIALFALIAAAAVSAYFLNETVHNFVDDHLLSSQHSTSPYPASQDHIFVLADGTYSTNQTAYNIPQVDTSWIHSLILKVHHNGGGKVWLSYIDQNHLNNPAPLYLSVPPIPFLGNKPTLLPGESRINLRKRQKDWERRASSFHADSLSTVQQFSADLSTFLSRSEELLSSQVYTRRSENKYTDLIGSINQTVTSMSIFHKQHTNNFIIAFSDMIHDPIHKTQDTLIDLPHIPKIIAVNPSPSTTCKQLVPFTTTVSNPELVFEKVFN